MDSNIRSVGDNKVAHIRRQAEEAADNYRGPLSNPYPEGSYAFHLWLNTYYARVQQSAIEVAA
jgi:hypothetical protein